MFTAEVMAKQSQIIFLEEWLQRNSDGSINSSSRDSSSMSAHEIIQAWSDLRGSLQHRSFHHHHFEALKTLLKSGISLHVADPQAKLLITIISEPNLPLPPESYPLFLRLLYIWVKKSSKPSLVLIDSAVEVLSRLFSSSQFANDKRTLFFAEGILLLGAISIVPSISEKSRGCCLELLCRLLEEENVLIGLSKEVVPLGLAGIGYGFFSSTSIHSLRILNALFGIWYKEDGHYSVSDALMLLHLIEWVFYNLDNSHSCEKIDLFSREILQSPNPVHASFAVVMAAAGVIRASNRSASNGLMQLRIFAEQRIGMIANNLVSETKSVIPSCNEYKRSLLLQCLSLALGRSGSVSSRDSLFLCLASAILTEIFPLQHFYTRILEARGNYEFLGLNQVKKHLTSVIFKEAGSVSRVLCNQYASASEGSKNKVENLMWDFCQDVYVSHRRVALMCRDTEKEVVGDLEKIAESAFLMVVVFAFAVTKHQLDSKFPQNTQLGISVKILVSFSCLEYFRRMRLSEYMDTIRAVVVAVQKDEAACVSFVESMPSYNDLTKTQGPSHLQKQDNIWLKDEVQTARILFYLRVIPTCVEILPSPVFRKMVAPVMFLYMGHPNMKVARASHSMFVAFLSSKKDSSDEARDSLKEQLVFYYTQRSLEGYPGVTPFEGMASGVAALVRYLPAGSPSIFYCISCLVEKSSSLCNESIDQESEPCKKFLDLLLRLLPLVDIQVLPFFMKLLAQLIVQLPKESQNMVLNDLYAQVAESDDVVRKPTLVSWLQSLSYVCQANSTSPPKERLHGKKSSFWRKRMPSFLGINARL